MIQRHPWLALLSVAVLLGGMLVLWEPDWLVYREVGELERKWSTFDVEVDSMPPHYYYNDWAIYSEQRLVTWAGDTVIGTQIADGFVDLTASSFAGCDASIVRLTDSTMVPLREGRTACAVRSGTFADTLRIVVRERNGRLVVGEYEVGTAS